MPVLKIDSVLSLIIVKKYKNLIVISDYDIIKILNDVI